MASAKRDYIEVDGVRLQSLTELEKSNLDALWGERYGKNDEVDMVMRRELVVVSLVDDEGNRLFKDDEVDVLGDFKASDIAKWYRAARKHSGFDLSDVEAQEKKSDATAA